MDYESLDQNKIWQNLELETTFEELINTTTSAINENRKIITTLNIKQRNPWATRELKNIIHN